MAKKGYNIIEVIQPRTGVTYIYEDYSYWNSEKGYSTHKRKSIGRIDEHGNRVYNKYYLEKQAAKARGEYVEEERINPTVKAKVDVGPTFSKPSPAVGYRDSPAPPRGVNDGTPWAEDGTGQSLRGDQVAQCPVCGIYARGD